MILGAVMVTDVLLWILILAGAFALVALGIMFVKLSKTLSQVNKIAEDNKRNIDDSLNQLPQVIANVDDITISVANLLEDSEPEIKKILANVSSVSDKAVGITNSAEQAVDSVTTGVVGVVNGIANLGNKTVDSVDHAIDNLKLLGANTKLGFLKTKESGLNKIADFITSIRRFFN